MMAGRSTFPITELLLELLGEAELGLSCCSGFLLLLMLLMLLLISMTAGGFVVSVDC